MAVVATLAGCGGGKPAPASGSATALTVDEWKMLPIEQKYQIDTYERLKQGDPTLEDQKAWDQFSRTVIAPSRKLDLPASK